MRFNLLRLVLGLACLVYATSVLAAEPQPPALRPHTITLANGTTFTLNLSPEFEISIAAQGLRRVRFMAQSPDGRIFVTDMYSRADNKRGTVYILDGFDPQTGSFAKVTPWLQHLRNPNNIAFYTDAGGQKWLYMALTDKLERFKFTPGENAPSSQPEVLATYPDYGLNYKYGGWHLTRTVAFGQAENKDKLYVSVGSSCNACEEKEEIRATVSVMDPDGRNQRILARGMRNAVGLRAVGGKLFATNMGADHLGDYAPDDPMFAVEAGNYGWPYCYFNNGKVYTDPRFANSTAKVDCKTVPPAYTTFVAHSSPLGLEYFDSSAQDAPLRNSFLVALHGASKKRLGAGYRLVRVSAGEKPRDFLTGFLKNGVIYGRPCDILRLAPDSFLLTDDYSGVIYYIHRK